MVIKRIMVFVMATVLLFALSACGKKATVDPTPDEPVVETTPPPPPVEQPVAKPEIKPEPMPVVDDVFFDYDKFALTSKARTTLEKNARQLKSAMSYGVLIEGHCDERGTNAYNLALGEKRAKATKDYLVSLGVAASRIRTVSYGEERPFEMGGNEAAWSKNRRSHFVLSKK